MKMGKILTTSLRVTSLLTLISVLSTQMFAAKNAKNPDPQLVNRLSRQLNVTPKQATGGAGAIFQLVKTHLSPGDFGKVAAAVPGMNGFLRAAPSGGGSTPASLTSGLPGGLGSIASLGGSFQSLGLSPSMVGKFIPIMQNYIGSKGGSGVASLFAGALN